MSILSTRELKDIADLNEVYTFNCISGAFKNVDVQMGKDRRISESI